METGIELPNGHLLNLNPRPRNNSNPNNRQNREAAVVQGSKLPTPESNGKNKSRLDSGKDSGTMSKTSPTSLPVPKSFAGKAKEQKKEKTTTIADNENPKTTAAAAADSGCSKDESVSPMTPQSGDTTDRETRLRRLQERLNKDSPLFDKSKEKQKGLSKGAYQKIMSLTTNGPEGAKTKLRNSETNTDDTTKLPKPGVKARTGIPSPSDKPRSASGGLFRSPAVHHAPNQKRGGPLKLQPKRPQQPTEEQYNDSSSQESSIKTDKTVDSSNSFPSESPISGPSSSATEWEDKFVVNMPSAKDPNPPMMTAQQIIEFQKSIEKVQREGGAMADPDASPSPRTTTPEDMRTSEAPEKAVGRGSSEPNTAANINTATNTNTESPIKESNNQGGGRYYSPEEVGKQRFSTIWEESPTKTKKQDTGSSEDGFFLGCKEIKGPEKNPDEILYFSTTTERPKVIDIPSPISAKPRAAGKPTGRRMVHALDDKIQIQKEWRTISDNLKKRQSSMPMPRTLCHEPACPQPVKSQMPLPKAPGKESGQAFRSSSNPINNTNKDKEVDSPGADDVVMNIPSVLHAPALPDTNAARSLPKTRNSMPASRVPAPPKPMSGLRQSSLGKDDGKSKPPSSSTTASSRSPPIKTSIQINKSRGEHRERPFGNDRGVRGYMRIPGLTNSSTENFTENSRSSPPRVSLQTSMSKDGAIADVNVPSRSVSGPAHVTLDSSSLRSGSPVSVICKDEDQDAQNNTTTATTTTNPPRAKIIELAELDGNQLHSETRRRKTFSPSIATVSSTRTATTTTTGASSNNDTDSINDEDQDQDQDQDSGPYPITLNLLFDILVISIAHFQRLTGDCLSSQYSQMVLRAVVGMVEHCIHVSQSALLAISVYRSTGAWPKSGQLDLGQTLTDLGQALVYLVALGFVMIILGRAAGYIVVIGSWVVWVAKPFGWTFGLLARALAP